MRYCMDMQRSSMDVRYGKHTRSNDVECVQCPMCTESITSAKARVFLLMPEVARQLWA